MKHKLNKKEYITRNSNRKIKNAYKSETNEWSGMYIDDMIYNNFIKNCSQNNIDDCHTIIIQQMKLLDHKIKPNTYVYNKITKYCVNNNYCLCVFYCYVDTLQICDACLRKNIETHNNHVLLKIRDVDCFDCQILIINKKRRHVEKINRAIGEEKYDEMKKYVNKILTQYVSCNKFDNINDLKKQCIDAFLSVACCEEFVEFVNKLKQTDYDYDLAQKMISLHSNYKVDILSNYELIKYVESKKNEHLFRQIIKVL